MIAITTLIEILDRINRSLIEHFPAGFDFEISNAITIAIEKPIRNDRTLIEHGFAESGFTGDDAPRAKAPHARGASPTRCPQ
ncbi:MAG TPA: hypothetical protein HA272_07655 [Methanoregula sp.]|nr:hypothetical protein [Methanoregula sp.]